ncbi:conserved membrane hypothetical protein [Tenacibaculum dicentrarchi]|uniref:DUF3899 domain-containing protein n=1 Tax=Tenacibaculum dicentrarchi TaxID=669041 RepID=A0ABM9NY78_9FLAO|nr:hypothetical protein [Tenacibaculum dicentrarchi]SOS55018.1 conserved membrane hypothetical protein [Tenacibaculum dicentrarchi]
MENKLKHLEFIQNTITRMSTNSFTVKGWSVAIITALFAFSANESNKNYAYLVYFIAPFFWYLNAFFLMQERRYRELYNEVRLKKNNVIDFSMDASKFNKGKCAFWRSCFGETIFPLYLILLLIGTYIILKM